MQAISIADMGTRCCAPCVHMVVEAADPCGPLRMARSCFLGYGCKPDHLFKGGLPVQARCMLMLECCVHAVIPCCVLGTHFADLLLVYICHASGWLRGPACCWTLIITVYTGRCCTACSSVCCGSIAHSPRC